MKISKVSEKVEAILKECPETRNSDMFLYYQLCVHYAPQTVGMSFGTVLLNLNELGLPKFETVRRARQKLQEYNEELRACEEVTEGRYERFKEVLEYVSK